MTEGIILALITVLMGAFSVVDKALAESFAPACFVAVGVLIAIHTLRKKLDAR